MDQERLPKGKKREKDHRRKKTKMRPKKSFKVHACHRKRAPHASRALPAPSRVCHRNCCRTKDRRRPEKCHQVGPSVPPPLRRRDNVFHLPDILVLVMQNQVEARRRMKCSPKTLIKAHVADCPSNKEVKESQDPIARSENLYRDGIM